MGTVILNIGQCGCQIGSQLLGQIQKSPIVELNSYLKRPSSNARPNSNTYHSIFVDTEPKILKPFIDERQRFSFIDQKNILYFQYGRGNNWGLGYMDEKKKIQLKLKHQKRQQEFDLLKDTEISDLQKKKPLELKKKQEMFLGFSQGGGQNEISTQTYFTENSQIIENIIEQTRREIEKTDYLLSINYIMSLAGGTGSGLGSRLIEDMRDILQEVQLNAVAIFPNKTGETPLQHYNCLLSLAHLQAYADSIIYFENERVYTMLNQLGSKQIDKSVDLTNVNEYISSCLMNLFWINDCHTNDRFYQDMLSECCVTPELKFVELMTSPFQLFQKYNQGPESTWEDIIKSCFEQFLYESEDDAEEVNNSLVNQVANDLVQDKQKSNQTQQQKKNQKQQQEMLNQTPKQTFNLQAVFKSGDVKKTLQESESHLKFLERKIKSVFNPSPWNPDAERSSKQGLDQKLSLAILKANSNKILPIIRNIYRISYQKFRSNAYLHWYFKYGLERDDFEEAFNIISAIDDNYTYMCN